VSCRSSDYGNGQRLLMQLLRLRLLFVPRLGLVSLRRAALASPTRTSSRCAGECARFAGRILGRIEHLALPPCRA